MTFGNDAAANPEEAVVSSSAAGAGLVTADGTVSHGQGAIADNTGARTTVPVLTAWGRVAAVAGVVAADRTVDQIQSSSVVDAAACATKSS